MKIFQCSISMLLYQMINIRERERDVYVANFALSDFRKSALANQENKLAQSHALKRTLHINSIETKGIAICRFFEALNNNST